MKRLFIPIILLLISLPIIAQKKERKGEFYFSWGYNKEWYTPSNLNISQPELNNNYTLQNTILVDHPGWDEGLFTKALSIPQYNYRFGYFFNKEKGLAFEINFDHTKALVQNNQMVHLVGKLNGVPKDIYYPFSKDVPEDQQNYYYLNNGANFLLFNIVKRTHFNGFSSNSFKLDGLSKLGVGPLIPHVENKLFGQANISKFQFGGWNIGAEYTIRGTIKKSLYLEFGGKLDYASYSNLNVYKGTAKQNFGTAELILSFGYTFPMGAFKTL
ncbi:MAG: hypothetical protein WCP61_04250 [Chitinophagia bacterium]